MEGITQISEGKLKLVVTIGEMRGTYQVLTTRFYVNIEFLTQKIEHEPGE